MPRQLFFSRAVLSSWQKSWIFLDKVPAARSDRRVANGPSSVGSGGVEPVWEIQDWQSIDVQAEMFCRERGAGVGPLHAGEHVIILSGVGSYAMRACLT